jgi:hypothetical protein
MRWQPCNFQAEAVVQYDWCHHLHQTHLAAGGSDLAPLRLSSSLQDSLWALSMVRSRTFSGAELAAHLLPPSSFSAVDAGLD